MSNNATWSEVQAIMNSKHDQLAAVFDSQSEADSSVETVKDAGISADQITLIHPLDPHFNEKLEQESEKIGKSLWRSHLLLGTGGVIAGLIAAMLLVMFGPELTQNNPMFTFIALISPGLFIGLFIAGLLGLRPDRDEIIQTVRSAVRRKKFALIIDLKKSQSSLHIRKLLGNHSNIVVKAAQ